MKKSLQIAFVVFLSALTLVPSRYAQAEEPQDAVIKGATDFLLDRAYDNYMYVLQLHLESNPFLGKYLPGTVRVAQVGDLRSLFCTRTCGETALKNDLETLANLKVVSADILRVVVQMCVTAKTVPEEPMRKSMAELCAYADDREPGKATSEKSLESVAKTRALVSERLGVLKPIRQLEPMVYITQSEKINIALQAIPELVSGLVQVEATCKGVERGGYTTCMVSIAAVLQAAARAEYVVSCSIALGVPPCHYADRKLAMHQEDREFADFLRYAVFFAQMADAEDPNTVKALLKGITVPSVSFGTKRVPFRTEVLISSYLGGGVSRVSSYQTSNTGYILAAPVGVEISQGLYSGNSLSLLLSPIDLGYPLSLKLNDSNQTVKTSDVIAPGAYLFVGLRNYPIAWGFGYTRVKSIENPDKRAGRLAFLIAFDMPLFTLY